MDSLLCSPSGANQDSPQKTIFHLFLGKKNTTQLILLPLTILRHQITYLRVMS